MPKGDVAAAEQSLIELKRAYNGQPDWQLHCRVLFATDARRKSEWSILTDDEVCRLYRDLLTIVKSHPNWRCLSCVAQKSEFPSELPAEEWLAADPSVEGGPGFTRAFKITEKWLEAMCGQAAAIPLSKTVGNENLLFFADPDASKVDSHAGVRQASNLVGGFVEGGGGRLTPTPIHGEKPALLEVADFFAYVTQRYWHVRSVCSEPARQFRIFYHALKFEKLRFAVGPDGGFLVHVGFQ